MAEKTPKKLRAVGYCRTSDESQRNNESIPYQKSEIERTIAREGWAFVNWYVDECKSGSKIAGRDEYQQLMRDAANSRFDLVVIFDIKRFGRNGVDILNDSRTLTTTFGVHVVDTKGGYDTRSRSILSRFVQAGAAEEERINILERTKTAKVAQARHWAAPAVSKKSWPFGRVWEKAAKRERGGAPGKWRVDPKAKAMMEDIAARYLAGESFATFADEYGWHLTTLHRVLTKRCGSEWTQHIRCKELGIDETIVCQIPPLLPDETIAAVLTEIERRKTNKNGRAPNKYLLTGFARCEYCGYALTGQTDRNVLVYRHHAESRPRAVKCPKPKPRPWIRAADIEENVIRYLFATFGNPVAVQRAIEEAMPDLEDVKAKRDRLERIETELEKVQRGRDRIMRLAEDDDLTDIEAKSRLAPLKEKRDRLTEEKERLEAELASTLTEAQARELSERVSRVFKGRKLASAKRAAVKRRIDSDFAAMTWDEKRTLVETLFGGKMPDGRPMGVYVSWDENLQWKFTLRGHLLMPGDDGWITPRPSDFWEWTAATEGTDQQPPSPRSELAVTLSQQYSRCRRRCSRG